MAFILTTLRDRESALHELVALGGGAAVKGGESGALALDGFSDFGSAVSRPGWQVLFEGYLDGDSGLEKALDQTAGQHKRAPATLAAELIARHGGAALSRLSGCFVLVARHLDSGEVLATRDRCGGRTVYFHHSGSELTLATRSAWVLHAAGLSARENPAFVVGRLALSSAPPPGQTAFEGVSELLPGELLQFKQGRLTIKRPSLDLGSDFDYSRPQAAVDRFLELLEQAVAAPLPAEGPVACMLSGGLDSGPVAVLADRQLGREDRALMVKSWRLDRHPEADEADWIRQTAAVLRAPADLVDLSEPTPFSHFDDSLLCADLPIYNAFRFQVNDCYRRAGEAGCRVILNANAGDEIYAPRHLLNLDRARRGQWRLIGQDLLRTTRAGGPSALLADPALRHPLARWIGRSSQKDRPPDWLTPSGQSHWQRLPDWPAEAAETPFPDYTRRLFGLPMAFGRAHEVEMAQRHGTDRRDPFHNEALLKFMLNAPMELSWRGGATKSIMRRAMRGLLPEPVRLKPRTGLLDSFHQSGLKQNKEKVQTLLFQQQTTWQQWVKPEVIQDILDGKAKVPEVLLSMCVGHAMWEGYWDRHKVQGPRIKENRNP